MYQMKKGGSSKGKKPKMQKGGMTAKDSMNMYANRFDSLSAEAGKKIGSGKDASKDLQGAKKARAAESKIAKRLYGTTPGLPQKKTGGSLKDVPSDKVGLSKLPTAVRNKMGYKKTGGTTKMKMGGSCGTPKSLKKK
jgi:hypothetical protein